MDFEQELAAGVWIRKPKRKQTNDEYYTPDYVADLIRPYLPSKATIWEAAWGQGHLARYFQRHGFAVVGSPKWTSSRRPSKPMLWSQTHLIL